MPDVIINVTPQPTASVEVDVDNVASYYYDLAKQWAISPDLVEQLDYSSKYYANVSKGYKEEVDALLSDSGFIAVSQDLANIDTVAGSISNVNAVATDISNVNAVYADLSNIDSVVSNATNINAVASNETNINTVATNITNVNTVATNITNVNTVATNISDINSVVTNITNINTTAQYISNINTVSNYVTQIDTIDDYVSDINTCSTNIGDIYTCASNISSITDKVNKTGDQMTGSLKFTSLDYSTIAGRGVEVAFRNLILDTDTTQPSDTYAININGYDLYGNYTGWVSNYQAETTNEIRLEIAARRLVSGNEKTARFGVQVNSTGNDIAYASAGVKSEITRWAYPSIITSAITVGATGMTWTATDNGYVGYKTGTGATQNYYVYLTNNSTGMSWYGMGNAGVEGRGYIPVAKGQTIKLEYFNVGIAALTFYKAIGG